MVHFELPLCRFWIFRPGVARAKEILPSPSLLGVPLAPQAPHSAVPQPSLNLDVLFLVLSFLERRVDRLSLIRTCRGLYKVGAPLLLQPPISLTSPEELSSLINFVHLDPDARTRSVLHLSVELDATHFSYADTQPFTSLLSLMLDMGALQELSFLHSESWANQYPSFGDTISSLPRLKSIHLLLAGPAVCEILGSLAHPIPKLHIVFLSSTNPTILVSMMDRLEPNLEELHITEVDLRRVDKIQPNLKSLILEDWKRVEKATLLRLFPGLRRLSYISDGPRREFRRADIRLNAENERAIVPAPWGCEYLQGDIMTLELLAASHNVHHLNVTDIRKVNLNQLDSLMIDAQPSCLSLEIHVNTFLLSTEWLRDFWNRPRFRKLLKLNLTLVFSGGSTKLHRLPVSILLLRYGYMFLNDTQGANCLRARTHRRPSSVSVFASNNRWIPITVGSFKEVPFDRVVGRARRRPSH